MNVAVKRLARRLAAFVIVMVAACRDDAAKEAPIVGAGDGGSPAPSVASTCPAGESPRVGTASCVAVGATCGAGFEKHPSGFGCLPILAPQACAGATRESLGSRDCVPVGDCDAPFPPPDATAFVEPGTGGPNRYATIQAALAQVPDGAVIAIADGTYVENLSAKRATNVVLAGRCAARTVVTSGPEYVALSSSTKLTVRGLTMRGGAGVLVTGHLTLEDVVLDGLVQRGVLARAGASATIVRSVIRNVVRDTRPHAEAVYAEQGGVITLEESVIAAIEGRGGVAFDESSRLSLTRSVVRDIAMTPEGILGNGVTAFEGASLSLEDSAIVAPRRTAVVLSQGPSRASLTRSTVSGISPPPGKAAIAVDVADTASLTTADFTIADSFGVGLVAGGAGSRVRIERTTVVGMRDDTDATIAGGVMGLAGAEITLTDSAIHSAARVGVHSQGSSTRITMTRTLVDGTRPSPAGNAYGVGVSQGATLSLEFVSVVGGPGVAIVADKGGRIGVLSSLVRGVKPLADGSRGIALLVHDSELSFESSLVEGAAGFGLFASAASARIASGAFSRNAIAMHVQDGSRLVESADVDSQQPMSVVVSPDVRFHENETRVGVGELALPSIELPRLDP